MKCVFKPRYHLLTLPGCRILMSTTLSHLRPFGTVSVENSLAIVVLPSPPLFAKFTNNKHRLPLDLALVLPVMLDLRLPSTQNLWPSDSNSGLILLGVWLLHWFLLATCSPWLSSLVLLHLSHHCPSPRVLSPSHSYSLTCLDFPRSGDAAMAMTDIRLLMLCFRWHWLCFMPLIASASYQILDLLGIKKFIPSSIGLLLPSAPRSFRSSPSML